jgi:hypothetical protein
MRGVVAARTGDVRVVLRDALTSGQRYRVVVFDVHAPQRDLALLETIQRELGWGHAAALVLVPLGYRDEVPPGPTGSVVAQLTRPWRLSRLRSTLARTIAAVQAAA